MGILILITYDCLESHNLHTTVSICNPNVQKSLHASTTYGVQ